MSRDDALWQRALRRVWAIGAQPGRGLDTSASLDVGDDLRDTVPAAGRAGAHGPAGAPGRGSVAEAATRRARATYEALQEPQRAALDALLASAPTERHRVWVLRAAAAGAAPATLEAFASRIAGTRTAGLGRSLDPLRQRPGVLRQQSPTTCGSATLLVARMLNDPVHALMLLDGYDARTGREVGGDVADRFRAEELRVKARTNDVRGRAGRLTLPWPHRLGTPPWGAREEMDGGAGVAGTRHRVLRIDSDSPGSRLHAGLRVGAAVRAGHPCPLFVGDGAVPRHVVLVVAVEVGSLTGYDPATGGSVVIEHRDLAHGSIDVAGWTRPWAAVVPAFGVGNDAL